MEENLIILSRIFLAILSIIVISGITILRKKNRTGNQFYVILLIFWLGVFFIVIKPSILDSVLNSTGLVNRSQFLFGVSIIIVIYLLILQTSKEKTTSVKLNHMIRKIALSNFKRELQRNSNKKLDLIIIIVAKDEEKSIGKVIDGIYSINLSLAYKIIVVNDGSKDKTEEIARRKNALVINHYQNLGIGGANKTGYIACKNFSPEIIINIDADGQHDPKYISKIISTIKDNDADVVYASRFSEQSDYKTTKIRSIGNKYYTKFVNKIAGISITDVTSGYRGIKFDKLKYVFFNSETNFAIELAIRAGKNNLKVMEIPTEAANREFGMSQFHKIEKFIFYNFKALLQIFNALLMKNDYEKYE